MPYINFTYSGAPMPKARPRFANGHAYTPKTTRGYEEAITAAALEAMSGSQMAEGCWVEVELEFYVPIPRSWSRMRKKCMAGKYHTQKPDLDNYVKAVLDACQGVIYKDDALVSRVDADKAWAEEGSEGQVCCVFSWEG